VAWKARVDARPSVRKALQATLDTQDYLAASGYSVADAYLFNLLRWPHRFEIDLAAWPALPRFQARIAERPAVRAALEAELV
jgi:glutathione S-transferase